MLMDAEETRWSRCIRIATVHGAYRMDMVVDANPGRVEGRRAPPSRPRVTGSHLPPADRIEDRPAGQLQRAGPQARPATAHEQTSHLHGPSIGGESSGAQEGGELGRPEVGRHSACGGMDRVSPLSGSATRAWRSRQDEHPHQRPAPRSGPCHEDPDPLNGCSPRCDQSPATKWRGLGD